MSILGIIIGLATTVAIFYVLAKRLTEHHYLHQGYEPIVDEDLLMEELDAEFGRLSKCEKAARLSA